MTPIKSLVGLAWLVGILLKITARDLWRRTR